MTNKTPDKRLGNKFWTLRSKHGRDKLFATPELLWKAACEYFEWCDENPLKEEKVFQYQGEIIRADVSKMRAMTMVGLCFYLHCNEAYFRTFKSQLPENEKDFNTIICDIEAIVYSQKFAGAAADLLNANIIARDLGLADRSKIEHDVPPDSDILRRAKERCRQIAMEED